MRKYPNTAMPKIMRYTPNTEKLWFRTYSISARIIRRLTIKLTTQPMASTPISMPVAETPESLNFSHFNALAPSMVGMARKKENSAPAGLATPRAIAPKIVEPERDVPGIRLRHWNAPIKIAVL